MDEHGESLLAEYREIRDCLEKLKELMETLLPDVIARSGIEIGAFQSRIKTEESLAGKLQRKGQKYRSIFDITDLFGVRIITFYSDEVDKIAALVENLLEIDRENSVDKRKMYETDHFGYMSLHYVCRVPKTLYGDPACPQLNALRFELQIRTTLQHAWANVFHDLGYKTDIDTPREYMRRLSCLAGALEMADREFLSIRQEIEEYRRKLRALISDGRFDDIALNADSFEKYLEIDPFGRLNEQIASLNHAEIQRVSISPYLRVLSSMGMKTLGDVERMKEACYEDAFDLARYQFGSTDLDIVSSTVGIASLCAVYALKTGGEAALLHYYDTLYGVQEKNQNAAKRLAEIARKLHLITEGGSEA